METAAKGRATPSVSTGELELMSRIGNSSLRKKIRRQLKSGRENLKVSLKRFTAIYSISWLLRVSQSKESNCRATRDRRVSCKNDFCNFYDNGATCLYSIANSAKSPSDFVPFSFILFIFIFIFCCSLSQTHSVLEAGMLFVRWPQRKTSGCLTSLRPRFSPGRRFTGKGYY